MKIYFVEGFYFPKPRKAQKGTLPLEPFAKTYWANSPEEALRLASEDLNGGQWKDKPHLSQKSEEQRMRDQGAPELPGLFSPPDSKKKKR